jgi:hypothetical protein
MLQECGGIMSGIENVVELPPNRKRIAPLTVILGFVFVFFCAVLVFVFVATKRANPVMLDPQGKPLNSGAQPAGGGTH